MSDVKFKIDGLELDLSKAEVGWALPHAFDKKDKHHQEITLTFFDKKPEELGSNARISIRMSRKAITEAMFYLKRQDAYNRKLMSEGKEP